MRKKIVIFLLLLMLPITNVKGGYCKYSDIAKYKGLASNISTYYDYKEMDNKIEFSVNLINLNESLYIIDTTTNKRYNYKSNELTISGYNSGQTIKFNVYTNDKNCFDQLLYTIRVNLPDYNPYYKDEICNGFDNYIYCQKWYKHSLNYDEFVKKVNKYKESLKEQPIIEQPIDEKISLFEIILDIWLEYYYIFLIPIILICTLTIYIVNKKSDIYN